MDKIQEVRIVYVDDSPETDLSKFLSNYKSDKCILKHEDVVFNPQNGYESLLEKPVIQTANIVLIDSKLFENRNIVKGIFTGEEFKLILRKHFPFIEVIVVTQNDIEDGFLKLAKYNSKNNQRTASEYYKEVLPDILEEGIKRIIDYRKIAANMRNNHSIEAVLVEKISNSLDGIGNYEDLSKSDIDEMVKLFKEVKEAVDSYGL